MAAPVNARKVPLLDLRAQHAPLREQVLAEITKLIDSQQFILGEPVARLEREIAAYSQARYGIGCASGSDALLLALMAFDIGAGDKVLTSPFTFFATAGAVARIGAIPVFADIDPQTFNLDPAAVATVLSQNPDVRAIIPVHLYGACADMDPINALARFYQCHVIEDSAQAIGAEYKAKRTGALGEIACFSFFPTKNLGGYGDGGMLTTDDEALAKKLSALRVHGSSQRYIHHAIGINSRLDSLQAVVLSAKFPHLDEWTAARQRNAALYRKGLTTAVTLPYVAEDTTRHVYNQFVILAPRRDELRQYLQDHGVGSEVYYPLPLHLQECFAYLGYTNGNFPVSERVAQECLALPIYPELHEEDIAYVCEVIARFYTQ